MVADWFDDHEDVWIGRHYGDWLVWRFINTIYECRTLWWPARVTFRHYAAHRLWRSLRCPYGKHYIGWLVWCPLRVFISDHSRTIWFRGICIQPFAKEAENWCRRKWLAQNHNLSGGPFTASLASVCVSNQRVCFSFLTVSVCFSHLFCQAFEFRVPKCVKATALNFRSGSYGVFFP